MKRIYTLAIVLVAVMMVSACINIGTTVYNYTEEGADYTEERHPGDFKSVEVSGPYNVYYVNSRECGVRIDTKEEFLDKVICKAEGGVLSLGLEPGTYKNLVLKVTVFSPALEGVKLRGSGDFKDLSGMIEASSLSLSTTGSGDIVLGNVNCSDADVAGNGSGDVMISSLRSSGDCILRTAGSGDMSIDLLAADGGFTARTSGSGDISIRKAFVKGDTVLKSSGSGNISMNGTCGDVEAVTNGSGDISGNLNHSSLYTETKGSGDVRFN